MRTAGKLAWSLRTVLPGPSSTPTPTGYPRELLQADLPMTEQMSVPEVSAPMLDGTVVEDQLRRSQHPACVAALQAYQREIGSHARRWTP